jgi:hypothetical protein
MITAAIVSLLGGGETMNKFGGVGLKNMFVISLFTMIMIVMLKVITVKHPIKGVTDFVNAI